MKIGEKIGKCGRLVACLGSIGIQFIHQAKADNGPWTAFNDFSGTEGENQWEYLERPRGGGSTADMDWESSGGYNPPGTGYWQNTDGDGWLYWIDTHPGENYDTLRTWVAPFTGNVSIAARAFKIDTLGAGTGSVSVGVEHNGTPIWSQTLAYNDGVGYVTDAALGQIPVTAGDTIAFTASYAGTFGYDQTGWNPTLLYSYVGSGGFSGTEGTNQWHYQNRPRGGGTVSNMTWVSSGGYSPPGTGYWQTTDGTGWVYWTDSHPGEGYDTMRTWVAPATGTVSITGRIYKIDVGGGAGVVGSIEQNGTQIWSKTVAYNDSTGYSMDGDPALTNLSVNAGDTISFILDDNGTFGYDQTGWDPMIVYANEGSAPPAWDLHTADTQIILSVIGNRPAITRLEDTGGGWNWMPSPTILPLLNKVYDSSGTQWNPNWVYSGASVNTSNGTMVTLTFTSSSPWPALTLTQSWWAAPSGGGPIEVTTSIANNTGGTMSYYDCDVISADLTVTADSTATLWRFDRASVNSSSDPGFTTGVFETVMNSSTSVASTASNDYPPGPYVLPFIMLDVGGAHGFYMGYESDFAKISTTNGSNANVIRNVFTMWDTSADYSFSQATGTTLSFPTVFYGSYKGNTDVGSNRMKEWYWAYKMTPTIRSTSTEPLVEYDISSYTESAATSFFASNPLSSWGVELAKEDYLWTSDASDTNPPFGCLWTPNSGWDGDMNLGSLAHDNGVKLALYMSNTYDQVDLGTASGVSTEEQALEGRYNGSLSGWTQTNGTGYDYWRSDMISETGYDYLSHLGLLQVLDYMIANHSGFRWENCSAGGSKKSFDLLQRQSVMTTEDSGAAAGSIENYRMAFYANSYMINPVQLKCDNGNFSPETDSWAKYMFRSGFFGAWMYGTDGTSPFELTEYEAHISLYKSYQRPILRGADVYHILPICNGTNWDGLEFFNSALDQGSVILLKPNSSVTTSPTLYLQGLNPSANYTLTFQDRTSLDGTYSGSTLMNTGISGISGTANDYDSEIIWINTGP